MKKMMRNVVFAMITKLALVISGIVAQRFILHGYGSEINGLTSSVSQFLAYFTLLEAGLGLASIQALYKPLANEDRDGVNGILSATSKQYQKTGLLFLILTIVLAFAMPFITNSSLDTWLIFGVTFLMGFANVLNYMFIGRYQALLSADRNIFVIHILDAVLGIAFSVIRIVLINWGFGIILVQTVALLSPVIRIVVLYLYTRVKYPMISYRAKPDFAAIGKRKFVLVHQIVGMVTNHTAVAILTLFSTLTRVSVYSIYNLIYNNISQILTTTFSTATQASFGKLYESKNPKFKDYYTLFEVVYTFMLFGLMTTVLLMTVPFVSLYTAGIEGVQYVDFGIALLFMLSILLSLVRVPSIVMVNVTGRFKETQRGAIIEAIIAIAVSVPGFFLWEIKGLLLGTCAAMLYRSIDIQWYNYKRILDKNILKWLVIFGINAAISVCFYLLCEKVIAMPTASWLEWLLAGVVYSVLAVVCFGVPAIIIYFVKYKKHLPLRIKH